MQRCWRIGDRMSVPSWGRIPALNVMQRAQLGSPGSTPAETGCTVYSRRLHVALPGHLHRIVG